MAKPRSIMEFAIVLFLRNQLLTATDIIRRPCNPVPKAITMLAKKYIHMEFVNPNRIKPNPKMNEPVATIFLGPNLSIKYPSTGPNTEF
jgi:hypothetical protein